MSDLYVNEPCLVSFFIGEMGWFLQKYQGYLRYIKQTYYPDHKCIIMTNIQYHPIIRDFVDYTIDLPKEFKELHLETDCFESPPPNSQPGSMTPPEIWVYLVNYVRQFYNRDLAVELWPPRGCNTFVNNCPQTFAYYSADPVKSDKPIIVIFPRCRARAANRNVPEFVWKDTVDKLVASNKFLIVLSGTPNGAALADYEHENVVNLISYSGDDKLEKTMEYVLSSVMTVGSQSGPTHLSLLCSAPTYTIGHEKKRHTVIENRFDCPTSFRYVYDYRAIDADTIIEDMESFLRALIENGVVDKSLFIPDFEKITLNDSTILKEMINMRLEEAENE